MAANRRGVGRNHPSQRGYTLIGLLFLVAGLGVGLAAVGTLWRTAAQREKERELLFIGEQFRQALAGYRRASPGGQPRNPPNLEVLLLDDRFPHTVRHLRRPWRDPFTGRAEWGLLRDEAGGITGVHSLAEAKPLKTSGFAPGLEGFAEAASYRDWVFNAQEDVERAETKAGPGGDPAAPLSPAAPAMPDTEAPGTTQAAPPASSAPPESRLTVCQTRLRQETRACRQPGRDAAEAQACGRAALESYRACLRGE